MEGYRIRKAASLLNVKVRTVREWIRIGKIKAVKADNGWYWMIPFAEIERLLNENEN